MNDEQLKHKAELKDLIKKLRTASYRNNVDKFNEDASRAFDTIKYISFISITIGVTIGSILIATYSFRENIPIHVNISTLGQFAASVAIMSLIISLVSIVAFGLPMMSQLFPHDRRTLVWLINNLAPAGKTTLGGSFTIYIKIHATILGVYLGFWLNSWIFHFWFEVGKIYIFLFFIPGLVYQIWLVYNLGKINKEKGNDPYISSSDLDDINNSMIVEYIYRTSLYGFIWLFFINVVAITVIANTVDDDLKDVIEYVLVSVTVVTVVAHYFIWSLSSFVGQRLVYGFILFILFSIFFIYPGATEITKNTLRYMRIGGGVQVEILLQEPEFSAIAKALSKNINSDNKCPCTTGKINLVLDLGDTLYIRPANASNEEVLNTVAVRRSSVVSIIYYNDVDL